MLEEELIIFQDGVLLFLFSSHSRLLHLSIKDEAEVIDHGPENVCWSLMHI